MVGIGRAVAILGVMVMASTGAWARTAQSELDHLLSETRPDIIGSLRATCALV